MTELLTQYGPYVFVVLAAFFLFAAGHHVGSNTAATAKIDPPAPKLVSLVAAQERIDKIVSEKQVQANANPKLLMLPDDKSASEIAGKLSPTIVTLPPAEPVDLQPAIQAGESKLTQPVTSDHAEHSVLGGAGSVVSEEKPEAVAVPAPVVAEKAPAETAAKEPEKTGIDAEVAKAHDALDKAGVFGPNRLIAIAAVRAGQVTGDDVARAHPVAAKIAPAGMVAKSAE